tara:strand:+ start:201 stop:698 length:498 start_codon:yes stop_codon:yes gene_type:complete
MLGLGLTQLLGIVSIAGQGIGTLLSLRSQQQALAYQQMQARMQEQQFRDQANALEIQTLQEASQRRDRYTTALAENRALMAGSGIDLDSPSYRAFFKANKETYKKDIYNIQRMGSEQRYNVLTNAQQARLTGQAAAVDYRTNVISTTGKSLLNMSRTGREFLVEK